MYIAFEGCIGAGKTTITNQYSKILGCRLMIEEYDKNPFMQDFYKTKEPDIKIKSELPTELVFLLAHLSQMNWMRQYQDNMIGDYCLLKNYIFGEANISNEDDLTLFTGVCNKLMPWMLLPDVIVYLRGSTDLFYKRILNRGNDLDTGITYEYVDKINKLYDKYFNYETCLKYNLSIIEVNMDHYNFALDNNLVIDLHSKITQMDKINDYAIF